MPTRHKMLYKNHNQLIFEYNELKLPYYSFVKMTTYRVKTNSLVLLEHSKMMLPTLIL